MSTTTDRKAPPRVTTGRLTAGDLRRCIGHLPDDAPVEVDVVPWVAGHEDHRPTITGFEARPSGVDLHITVNVAEAD